MAQVGGLESERLLIELGARETVDHRRVSLREWSNGGKEVDLVIDNVGGNSLRDAWYCVKDGGVLISIVEPPEGQKPEGLERKGVKNLFFIMTPNGEQLGRISKLIERGECRPVVDSVWSFEEYEEAFKRLEKGHPRGKVVIKVAQ